MEGLSTVVTRLGLHFAAPTPCLNSTSGVTLSHFPSPSLPWKSLKTAASGKAKTTVLGTLPVMENSPLLETASFTEVCFH